MPQRVEQHHETSRFERNPTGKETIQLIGSAAIREVIFSTSPEVPATMLPFDDVSAASDPPAEVNFKAKHRRAIDTIYQHLPPERHPYFNAEPIDS